ncbi:tRNA (guanosine(37)-N1)-methyltransferase TrmD [Candidatus Saganbacteria bacterium]|nr:tRNA (guanosine(37)-N1)-methyltransferase TrmD [Candidatus Saganbacteria bacterium]
MKINVLTLFPEMFEGPFSSSLIKKAIEKKILALNIINIRDFTEDKHKTADDSPYGGGAGMVMKPEPIYNAIKTLYPLSFSPLSRGRCPELCRGTEGVKIIYMSPTGKQLTNDKAKELSKEENLIIICGHYEGIDERIRKNLVTDEISIGDYVLTGGELPAMVLIDSVSRHIPDVVKEEDSLINDSFYNGLLDHPSYTKPEVFNGENIPAVLMSGHHEEIARYRRKEALRSTFFKRPELLATAKLKKEDTKLLEDIINGS